MNGVQETTDSGQRTKDKSLAVVLASGGMDSLVTTAIAHLDYRLATLHVAYGQRTERRAMGSFTDLADFYKAEHRLACRLEHLRQIGGSSLTDSAIAVGQANLGREHLPPTPVPFRNPPAAFVTVARGACAPSKRRASKAPSRT